MLFAKLWSHHIWKNCKSYKIYVPSHLHIFWLNFDKANLVSSTLFRCWEKQIFERMLPWGMSNFLLLRAWWYALGGEFWIGRDMSKNASNKGIFYEIFYEWNVKFENFSHIWWNIKVWEKIQQAFWREINP